MIARPNISSRQQPCPACNGEDGACRILPDNTVFCHGLADLKKGEKANGFVCVKDAVGHTSTLKPDNSEEWSAERKREWEARKAARQQQARDEERQREERALSPQKRHELYSLLFEKLSLSTPTLEDLQRRGFNQKEVEDCGFKSIVAGQKLPLPFDSRLPGIGQDGRSLAIKHDGYLCPIYDVDGNVVAFQVRLQNPPDGNRYRWLSTPSSATLQLYPEGENPLTVLRPVSQPKGIGLVEGVGAKPFLAARRLNLVILGAPGGQWSSSPKLTQRYLEQLYQEVGGEKIITLYPDAGDVCNADVVRRWKKIANLLVDWGWSVRFAWWGQSVKSLPDVDELQPEQLSWISYLSIGEFKALCVKWGSLENKTVSEPIPISYEDRVAKAQQRLHSLSYPLDLICDPSKKYLPDLVGRIPTKGLVGLKSPKGSGKSHQIKLIKDYLCGYWEEVPIAQQTPILPTEQLELLEKKPTTVTVEVFKPGTTKVWRKGLGMRFLSINARIALGREQAIRWEFTWIEDADFDSREEFGGERIARNAVLEEIDGIGLCWDSLNKIFGRDWSNTLVVIDELELGLNHVSTSSTCRDRRSLILHTLEHKLRECLDNGGMVLVADADLSDVPLDYLTTIAPGHPPYLVGHDFKGEPWETDFYTGKRDVVLSQIDDWLSFEDCRPIAVTLDNQKEAESLSMFLTEKYPWLGQQTGGLIRIDSKITQTDFGKKFVQYPNESIVGGKDRQGKEIKALLPKVLIYTPSLGVGCSIDVSYFAHVFSFNFGNVEPSQARQSMARIRQPVPRTVWAKEQGASNSENEPTSYLPEEIKRRMFDSNEGLMTTMLTALSKARELAHQQGIANPEDKDLLPLIIEELQAMMGIDGSWNNPHIDLYADQTARRNFSLSQFAVQLQQELIDEGHILRDCQGDGATNAGDAVTEGKKEIKRRNATATATAKDISYEEAQEVRRKPTRSDQEEHAMAKAFMKHDLPGVELTPEFVLKAKYEDNGRWLSQAKLFWHVYNLDACKDKDEREWKYRLNQFSKGVVFLPDIKSDMPKVEAILKSGVLDWVKPSDLETEYSNESPEGQAFVRNAYAHRKIIKIALNITVQRDSEPVKLASRILDRIGLGLTYSRRDKQGDRVRYYKLNEELATDSDRKAVWEALDQRWRERFSKNAETSSQQGQNLVQNENDFLYITEASGQENQPQELGQNCVVDHTTEQWKEEEILDLALALEGCEEPETLDLLRQCQDIPIPAFKAASDLLPSRKREQIRQWVMDQNSA